MRFDKQDSRCPYLNTEKVTTCGAVRTGLRVPSKKEIFEYCKGKFHLCRTYQEGLIQRQELVKEVRPDG